METPVRVLRAFEGAAGELTAETAQLHTTAPALVLLMHDSSPPHHP